MPTIPDFVPPVTSAGDLNTQKLQSEIVKVVAGDASVIPVAYGKVQLPGKVFAVVYDDVTDPDLPVWTIGVYWCFGECEAIDATYLNAATPTAGVTVENHLGTTSQAASTLMTAAKLAVGVTYSDTLVISDDRGVLGICYSVFQFDDEEYELWPEFIGEIDGRKVFDPREAGHDAADPSTWAATETPALAWRDWVTTKMFGPAEGVDDSEVESTADSNDAGVPGTEERRQVGLVIDTRQSWDTWRKILETYAGAWGYKRGAEWVLKSDRPREPDFVLTDDSFVRDSFKISITPVENIPTLVRVWFTDKTDVIWRDRMVEAELTEVNAGLVERRTSEIKLPGIGRATQARREAIERLNKLNRFLQFQGTLVDDYIGVEVGDVVRVTHKSGLDAVQCRVIPFPGMEQAGRLTIRAIRYSELDYSDSLTGETVFGAARFLGQVGGSATGLLALVDQADTDNIEPGATSRLETAQSTATTDLTSPVGTMVDIISDTIDVAGKLESLSVALRVEGTVQVEWEDTTNDVQAFQAQFWLEDADGLNRATITGVTVQSLGRDSSAAGTLYEGMTIFTISEEFLVAVYADSQPLRNYEGAITYGIQIRCFGGGSFTPDVADVTFVSTTGHLVTR